MKHFDSWLVRTRNVFPFLILFGILNLSACQSVAPPQVTATLPQPTATNKPPTPSWEIPAMLFPLSEKGPYQSRTLSGIKFMDESRNGRQVAITIFYPALDGKPDFRGAPYPLILSSTKVANIFATHLVSHGFVVIGVNKIDYYDPWDNNLIDQPLDILFALNQVASTPPEGLEGMIDADHAGAMGYSFDGYNSLAMSGARVDPEYYLKRCADAPNAEPPVSSFWNRYFCTISRRWDNFSAHAGESLTTSDDGLWQPMTDKRIQAVMPMAPEGAWIFGERGLATVDRPILIIGATEDEDSPYETEAVFIFEHLNVTERFFISFVGQNHMMIYNVDQVAQMKHFAVAFFSTYLQGRTDYAQYFSEEFVTRQDGLAWGPYK
jgi:predicted dienelactone hydrolase